MRHCRGEPLVAGLGSGQASVALRLGSGRRRWVARARMKKILELLLCIVHPVAVVLIWVHLALRSNMGLVPRLTWAIASIVPFVPFVYVLTGNEFV